MLENNYVAFFQELRKSDYFTASLLYSYVNKVRANALKTINSTYTVPNKYFFPLNFPAWGIIPHLRNHRASMLRR
jgi:hypothetical protein